MDTLLAIASNRYGARYLLRCLENSQATLHQKVCHYTFSYLAVLDNDGHAETCGNIHRAQFHPPRHKLKWSSLADMAS